MDFEALARKFEASKKRTEVEKIKGALRRKITQMVQLNNARVDYQERLERLIDEYNAGSRSVDNLFRELVRLATDLDDEQQRAVKEELSEEQLAVFDLLTKPAVDLTQKERELVKQVARDLLGRLQGELVLDWRKRQLTRARVQQVIAQLLERLPDRYDLALYRGKCEEIYQHVYESYSGAGRSIYAAAAT
jgi:type I restriction enzyme R subunit